MENIRIIARMDIKSPNLVKCIQLEGLRQLGDPNEYAVKYYEQGIDEIIYMDIVASLYNRNNILFTVRKTAENVFIPLTVGGGIRSVEDARMALRSGADKVAVNTAAISQPNIISDIARAFGSQCAVLSIEAKKTAEGYWEAYYNNGREKTGIDAVAWARRGYELGAGEILLTSVDKEGTARGMDKDLLKAVTSVAPIPVIASGGIGCMMDISDAIQECGVSAIAMAHVLHYEKLGIKEMKDNLACRNVNVRPQ